jgi:hypothetical protein
VPSYRSAAIDFGSLSRTRIGAVVHDRSRHQQRGARRSRQRPGRPLRRPRHATSGAPIPVRPVPAAYARGFDVLRALVRDFEVRRGSDKSAPLYRGIDDKWLFTRSMFEDWASDAGFRELEIQPLHDVDRPFTAQTLANLRLAADLDEGGLPGWCWERLAIYDESFSAELKRDLLIEGSVLLRK